MHQFLNDNNNIPLSKFELMLKTNSVYFFDAGEFEEIILFYIDSGKFSLAKKALKLGLTQHPSSVGLKLIKIEIFILDEKLEEAELLLTELEKIEPSNEEIHIQRATIQSKRGNHRKAIEALQMALLFADEDSDILSMIGMEYLYLDEFDTARLNFIKCLDVEYDDYSSLYNIIYCFDMLEQHKEAIDYLKAYIDKKPFSEIAWHQLGRQYFTIENFIEALAAFDYAILIDEFFIGAHLEKAKTLEELNKYKEAIEFYHLTMELDTPTSFAYLRIGKCYEKLEQKNMAIEFYNKTVNEDPLLDKGWLALTEIYISNKDYQKALFYIKKALSIDEENNVYWQKLAEINLKLDLFEEAARAYLKCIEFDDVRLEMYIAVVDVLHFLGEFNDAINILLDAREKYKNHAEITYRLAGLYFLTQKENEGLFFLENSFRIDYKYYDSIKVLFPIVFERKEVANLERKYKLSN